MATEKFKTLLKELLTRTRSGTIKWGETADDNSYRVKLGAALVRVSVWTDENEDAHVGAYLINPDGKYVDSEIERVGGPLVDPLWDAARASALNAEELLDEALKNLQKGNVSSPRKDSDDKDTDIPF